MSTWIGRMIAATAIACLVALNLFAPASAEPASQPAVTKANVIRVEALIDGRSRLLLKGKTAQWQHMEYAAPGRLDGNREATVLNGKRWMPEWPDQPDEENRDCKCKSDTYEELDPAVPEVVENATVKLIQKRGKVKVVQMPKSDNDHTLILEFDDNAQPGFNPYVVDVSWTVADSSAPAEAAKP